MNNRILIAPYPAKLFNNNTNPKSYPYWTKLVELLNKEGYEVIQIGVSGEVEIAGVNQFITNFPFSKIRDLAETCATWISCDSWFQHFAHFHHLKRGVVLFGPSDPRIFGYRDNVNLLRGRDFLRPNQFASWMEWNYDPNAFVYAENVIPEVVKLAPILTSVR